MFCRQRFWIVVGLVLVCTSAAGLAEETPAGGADREWKFIDRLRADGMVDVAAGQLEEFARNFRDDPRAPLAWLEAGRIHEELGQNTAAQADYEALLAHFPASEVAARAAYRRAELLTEAQEWEAAADAYRSLLQAYPASDRIDAARLGLGEALMALRQDAEARSMLRRLIAGKAAVEVGARARFDLGVLAQRAESDSVAVERFDSVARLYPDQPIAGFALLRSAQLLVKSGDLPAATQRFESVLDLETAPLLRGRARFGLAAILGDTQPEKAMDQYQAIAREGASAEQVERALLELGDLALRVGDPDRGRKAAEEYLETFGDGPASERARLVLARADLGRREEGVEELQALWRAEDPRVRWEASRILGEWQAGEGDFEAALRSFRHAESVAEDDSLRGLALLRQAECALASKEAALAADLAQRAVDVGGDEELQSKALLLASRASEMAGRRSSAVATAERLVREHPRTESAVEARGLLRQLRRRAHVQPAEAARALAELAARPIDDPAARAVEIGVILRERLGDVEGAVASFEQALRGGDAAPSLRSRAGWELARTHLAEALEAGLAGQEEVARRHWDQARQVLSDAAARAGAAPWDGRARVALLGLDLSEAARPQAPWLFDADRMPLLGAVGPAESVNRSARGLEATRQRLDRALDAETEADDHAWLVWRAVELSPAPVEERLARLETELKARPPQLRELQLRYARGQLLLEQKQPVKAARELSRILDRAPASDLAAAARYGLAEAHRAQQNYGAAYDLYLTFAAAYPQSVRGQRALLLAGDCALLGGHADRAVSRYRELIDRYPDTVYLDDALYRLGTALHREGKVGPAQEALRRLLQRTQNSDYEGRALSRLAQIESSAGEDSTAVATLRRLQEVDPERAVAEGTGRTIARLEYEQGHFREALRALDELTEEDPGVEAQAIRVRALSGAQRQEEALRVWESLRVAAPDQAPLVAELRCELGEAFAAAGDREAAEESFAFVVETARSPELLARAHYQRGVLAAKSGNLEEARAEFEAAIEPRPSSRWTADGLYQLSSLQMREGEVERAQEGFARVSEDFPDHPRAADALSAEALAWRRMSRYDEALERYHSLLERYPEREGAEKVLSNIAYCHHELGQYDIAIEAYRRVMPYLDEEGQAYAQFWIADSLAQLQRYDEAAAGFLRIPYLFPKEGQLPVTAQLKAAEVYEKMGNRDAAVRIYQKVIRTHGERSQWGGEAKRRLDRLATATDDQN